MAGAQRAPVPVPGSSSLSLTHLWLTTLTWSCELTTLTTRQEPSDSTSSLFDTEHGEQPVREAK
jgi:hypothetical protein